MSTSLVVDDEPAVREFYAGALAATRWLSTSTAGPIAGADPIEQWLDKKLTHIPSEGGPPAS